MKAQKSDLIVKCGKGYLKLNIIQNEGGKRLPQLIARIIIKSDRAFDWRNLWVLTLNSRRRI